MGKATMPEHVTWLLKKALRYHTKLSYIHFFNAFSKRTETSKTQKVESKVSHKNTVTSERK